MNVFCKGLAALFLTAVAGSACAQTDEFMDMTLEELVNVDIYASSVLSSHIHRKGEWMVGYEFMGMDMDGNIDGNDHIDDATVLQDFMVAPTSMSMDMHMLHVMHAVSDKITVMAMFRYHDNSMQHLTRTGGTFETQSSGLGDTSLSANHVLTEWEGGTTVNQFALTYGLSLPTGSIDETAFLPPMMATTRLPYPMQLGSGTYDVSAGAMYLGYTASTYWGAHLLATTRTGENDNDYRLGNSFDFRSWVSKSWTNTISTFGHLDVEHIGNIHGADPVLNPMMVPTADPNRRAQTDITLGFGVEWNALEGQIITLAFSDSVYHDVDGPQLEPNSSIRVGWRVTF